MRLRKEVSSDCQENVRCVGEGTWIQRILSFYPRLCTKKKQQMGQSTEAALPLESIPGIAQVDFGEAPFVYRVGLSTFPTWRSRSLQQHVLFSSVPVAEPSVS